jgi:hypothetical protein
VKNARGLVPSAVLLLLVGFGALSRFAPGVRGVAVVGLTGAGASLAVGICLLIRSFRTRSGIESRGTRAA